jgi:methylmalonyl-CoA mutase
MASGSLGERFRLDDDFEPVTYDAWREAVEKDLRGAPFDRKLVSHLYEGIDVRPVYTRDDVTDRPPPGHAGMPPFTRGAHPIGGALCGWDIRQEFTEPEPESANAAILQDLEGGVTSVHLRLDAATRNGRDPDDPESTGRVGRDGCTVATVDDLDAALKDVRLDIAPVSLESGAAFVPAAALLMALWARRGHAGAQVAGAFNADPLAVFARDGALPGTTDEMLTDLGRLAAHTREHYPRVSSVRVGTAPYHHAGATAVQDLAFGIATGIDYLRAMTREGLSIDEAAGQVTFSFAVGCNFFLAASKLRAARRLWWRVVTASGGSHEAARARLHVKPSKRVLTRHDPWVNLLRNTATTFAASVGGAEIVTTLPLDAAIGLPDGFSRRIARNTQVILQEECHLHRVADPAGGSWFIESLTDDLCEKAWAIVQNIEGAGGMARALQSGWIESQVEGALLPRLRNIATRRDGVTGVSEFPLAGEKPLERREPAYDEVRARAIERLERRANVSEADQKTAHLADVVRDRSVHSVAACVEAATAGASVGDLTGVLWSGRTGARAKPMHAHPYAEAFEHLRDEAERFEAMCGHPPRAFLVQLGPVAAHTARSGFAKGFLEAGGFEVLESGPLTKADAAEAAEERFGNSGARVAVLCSSDALYPELVPVTAGALKRAGATHVVLAGHPGEHEAAYRAAGVDMFIYIKCDVVGTLTALLRDEGVLS